MTQVSDVLGSLADVRQVESQAELTIFLLGLECCFGKLLAPLKIEQARSRVDGGRCEMQRSAML